MYLRKDPVFSTSSFAKMQVDQKIVQMSTGQHKASSYPGVKVTEESNADVAYVHQTFFQTSTHGDHSQLNTYTNFLVAVGQIARVGIALKKLKKETLWKPGELFKIASNISFFTYVMKCFGCCSTPATLMNKAAQFVKFVNSAYAYFDSKPPVGGNQIAKVAMLEKINCVSRLLRRDRSTNKNIALRLKQVSKEDWHHCSLGKFINEDMFDHMRLVALIVLQGIPNTVNDILEGKTAFETTSKRRIFDDFMLKNQAILRKWCVNFLALILLYGNGQRKQVYWMLLCPSLSDLAVFSYELESNGPVKPLLLEIDGKEKRPRASKLPHVMMNPIVFKYVEFQVQMVIPHFLDKHGIEYNPIEAQKLLLDIRNARNFNSNNIRNTLSRWVKALDPELHFTPMDIRSSYCTIMIRRHAHRREISANNDEFVFQNLSEEEFKEMLACVMNTSIEQINSLYAAASHTDYATQVAKVMSICKSGSLDK